MALAGQQHSAERAQAERELVWAGGGRNDRKPRGIFSAEKPLKQSRGTERAAKVITSPSHKKRYSADMRKKKIAAKAPSLQDRLQARKGKSVFAGDEPKAKPKRQRRCAADVGSGEWHRDAVAKSRSPIPSPSPRRKRKRKKAKEGASAAAAIDLVSDGEEEEAAPPPPPPRRAVAAAAPRPAATANAHSAPLSGDRRRFDAGAVHYSAGDENVEFTKSTDWRLVFKRGELTLERKSNATGEGCLLRLSSMMVLNCRIHATPRAWLHVNVATKDRERVEISLGLDENSLRADAFGNIALRVYCASGERGESAAWVADIRAAAKIGEFTLLISDAATDDGDDSERPYIAALHRAGSAARASSAGGVGGGAQLRTSEAQARRLRDARGEFKPSPRSAMRVQPQREDTSSDGALARALVDGEKSAAAAKAEAIVRKDAALARQFHAAETARRGGGASSASAVPDTSGDAEAARRLSEEAPAKRRSSRRRKSTRLGSRGVGAFNDDEHDETNPAVVVEWPFNAETGRVERDSVLITQGDCNRLREGHFLNDNLIDFYLRLLQRTHAGVGVGARASADDAAPPRRGTVKIFSSFFYKQLRTGSKRSTGSNAMKMGFDSVKRWTLNDDIFSYDFLLIPVCQALHWSLAVVCHPRVAMLRRAAEAAASSAAADDRSDEEEAAAGSTSAAAEEEGLVESAAEKRLQPCILYLDSLGCHKTKLIGARLRGYLRREWDDKSRSKKQKKAATSGGARPSSSSSSSSSSSTASAPSLNIKKAEMPNVRLNVPMQNNGCDCGVFVLKYSECLLSLLEKPPSSAPARSTSGRSPYDAKVRRSSTALPLVVSSSSASATAWQEQNVASHDLSDLISEDSSDSDKSVQFGIASDEEEAGAETAGILKRRGTGGSGSIESDADGRDARAAALSALHVVRPRRGASAVKEIQAQMKDHIGEDMFTQHSIRTLRRTVKKKIDAFAKKQKAARRREADRVEESAAAASAGREESATV